VRQSLLLLTGQVRKFLLMLLGAFAGAVYMTFPNPLHWLGGLFALGSFALGFFAIRCPRCGTRWLWHGFAKSGDPHFAVREGSVCPVCRTDFRATHSHENKPHGV
jgi:hypothetical protein